MIQSRDIIPIVYIIASLKLGGTEKQLYLLLKGLNRESYRPHVITYSDGFWRKRIEEISIPVSVFFCKNKISSLLSTYKQIKRTRPQIVHSFGSTAGYVGRIAAILARTNVIIASERSAAYIKSGWKSWMEKILCQFANRIICNAAHSAAYYVEKGIASKDKIKVIYNGIDIEDYPLVDPQQGRFSVGYIANFKPEKNHLMLIEAARKVVSEHPNVVFHFAGDGILRQTIEDLIRKYGLSRNFVLHGTVMDIQAFLRSIDIYVHTSSYEGLPNAIMEAMASGLPCIVTRADGGTELVEDSVTAFLVKKEDTTDLSNKIKRLFNNHGLMVKLGRNGRERIESNFTHELMVNQTEHIYEKELSNFLL